MLRILDNLLAWLDRLLGDGTGARTRRGAGGDWAMAAFLLAPALIVLGCFGVVPLGYAAYMSLHRYAGRNRTYVGLANFREVIDSPDFWNSFRVTSYYAAGTVPGVLIVAVIGAFAVFRVGRFL
ncbi:MAG: hypothetical protein WD873_08870, partial [Candidatus Hydrogenedentales bacterium]